MTALLTDFGRAKRVAGDSELTLSGAIVGTPAYMAAEQVSGRRGSVTTATDVHGLGAVLYALLTGQPPYRGELIAEALGQVREARPEPPLKLNPRVPRDLATICLKCLEKDPRRRYDSAAAVAEDLGHWLGGEPVVARPVGRAERPWLWCRRNPMVGRHQPSRQYCWWLSLSARRWRPSGSGPSQAESKPRPRKHGLRLPRLQLVSR
jgi:serine/threonine-protein kinase